MLSYLLASGTMCQTHLYSPTADAYHKDITSTIERIVNIKKGTFVGGMYGRDDLAQEIRIRLIDAVSSVGYNKSFFHFLVKCADNLILDIWRGVYRANNPPCKKCASGHPCQPGGKKCRKALEYETMLKRRREIDRPAMLNDGEPACFDYSLESLIADELHQRIIAALPPYLLRSYHEMINAGGKGVPGEHKRKIRVIVRGIIRGSESK